MKKYIFALLLCLFSFGMNAAIYVAGTFNSWAVANPTYQLLDNGNGVFYISLDLIAGSHHFKLTDGTWSNSIASDRIITLAAPATIKIYAKTSKSFVCDTQDAFYITGSATGTYAWGGANMLPMTISGQKATVTTTVMTGQQGNMYRDLTPIYAEQIYRTGNFSFPTDVTMDGKTKVITFDFATYTLTLQDPVATAVPTTSKENFTYSVNNKQIHVNVDNSILEIYTVSGQKLFSKVVSGSVDYMVENSGVYLLRSKGTTYKVIIH